MGKQEAQIDTLLYIRIFAFFLVIIIVGAIFVKVFLVVKNSTFNTNAYNILVVTDSVYIIGANKNDKRITVLRTDSEIKDPKKSRLLKYGLDVGIPFRGMIEFEKGERNNISPDIFSLTSVLDMVNNDRVERYNVGIVDLLRFYWITLRAPKENLITLEASDTGRNQLFEIFRDEEIINRKISIEVINGTGINGLGNKFSIMLTNAGYNIISVITREEILNSLVVSHTKNKITKRLSSDLGFDTLFEDKRGIADISILIGQDIVLNLEE